MTRTVSLAFATLFICGCGPSKYITRADSALKNGDYQKAIVNYSLEMADDGDVDYAVKSLGELAGKIGKKYCEKLNIAITFLKKERKRLAKTKYRKTEERTLTAWMMLVLQANGMNQKGLCNIPKSVLMP